jgi:hypothetical protein
VKFLSFQHCINTLQDVKEGTELAMWWSSMLLEICNLQLVFLTFQIEYLGEFDAEFEMPLGMNTTRVQKLP